MEYLVVKWLHVLSSTLLLGTGVGSAYYLFFTSRSRDPRAVAVVAGEVAKADLLFTGTTIVFQPLSGLYLMHLAGWSWRQPWILWSLVLLGVTVLCWLPVVWLQLRLRDIAREAVRRGTPLPPAYDRALRWWVVLGFPALFALLAVFYLMVAKPMGAA